ncbi:hypothetical protein LAZ67_18001422, partial [Cordylochernes scorpioides]
MDIDEQSPATGVSQQMNAAHPPQDDEENNDNDGPWTTVTNVKKPRIPPVIAENVADWKLLCQELKNLCMEPFQVTISGKRHIIKSKNIGDFKKIREYVQKNNGGYSYRLQEEKPLKVVLKGVSTAFKEEDVVTELVSMGFTEVVVKRLHRQSTKIPMNIVLVELPKNEQNKRIYGITEILYQKIVVESFRTTKRVTQCFNCQGFGHGQLNCFLKPKCVKCAEEHHSKDCPRKSKQLPPKCANCGEAHTANYRGCPNFPKPQQQQLRPPRQNSPNTITQASSTKTEEAIVSKQKASYAETAKKKTTHSDTRELCEKCGIEYKVEETLSTKKRTRESPSDSTSRSHKTPRMEVVSQHNENDVSMNEVTEVPQETSAATPSQVNEEDIDEDGPWTKVTHAKKPRYHLYSKNTIVSSSKSIKNPKTKALIREKNKARKRWQSTWDPAHRATYLNLQGKVNQALEAEKSENWNSFLSKLESSPTDFWKKTKPIRKKTDKITSLNANGKTLLTDKEIGNELSEHFSKHFSKAEDEVPLYLTDNTCHHPQENILSMTTPNEVKEVIKNLGNHKAPGHDNITPQMTKNLPIKWIVFLAGIFNAALHLCYYPKTWKHAIIITIPKKSPVKSPEDLRPINLLSTIGKVYERIVLRRLQSYMDSINFIIPQQFGFRKGHSTTHQLITVIDYIQIRKSHKEAVGAVFLDFTKAFDRVWHDGLIAKITKNQFPKDFIKFLKNYLQDRTFSIKQGNYITTAKPTQIGVPQGSILGPYLFNIYINDFPPHPKCQIKLFADDAAILSNSKSIGIITTQLQNYINSITKWCNDWKLDINPKKSQAIIFPPLDNKKFKPQSILKCVGKKMQPIVIKSTIGPAGENVSIIDTNILLKILERCGIEYKVEETPSTKKRTRESPSDSTPRSHKTPRIEVVSQHNENDVSMNETSKKIREYVQKNIIDSYRLQEEKPLKVVLKGVTTAYKTEDIAIELETMGFAETSVKRLHRQSTKRPMNLVLVELPKNEQNKKIYGITELLYQKIAVESFRTTNRVTQCFNCQVFGHGQLNCFLKPKCVKCAEEHHSKDCPRKSRQLPPKCANCEEAHTANYRGCPKFPRVHQQQPRYPGQYKPNNPLPISKRSETLPKIVEQQNQSNAEVATRKTSRSETKDLCEKYDASNQNISTMNCKLPFKIIAWNCNGIRSGKEELLHFLEVNSIDIALLSETHLKPSIDLKFRNYQTIRTDRITGKGGGTAIIIKSFFKYKNMLIHTLNLENTSILIKPDGKPLLQITAIYKKPDAPLLEEDLNQLIKHNHSIIVAGDWNSKHPLWGSRTSNNSGIVLHNFSERESLDIVAPSSPTHYSPLGNPDFLDFAVLKNIPWTPKARTTDDLSSDHLPVIFELNCPKDEFTTQLSRVTNWVHFQQDIISTTPPRLPLKAEVYIDSAVGILNEKINNSYSKNTIVSSSKLIKNPKTKALIREKNKARKRWQSTWDPAHRATYLNLQGKCVGKKMQPIVIKSTIGPAGENVSIIDTNILLKILERCGIEYKVEETPSTKKRTRESPSDSTPRSHKTPRIEVVSQHNENDVSMNEVTEVPQETSAATPSQVNEENIDEDGPWTKVTHAKKPRIPPVIAENVTDWKLLCQELKDLCTEEKPLKVVLKGVTTAYKTEDIAIELETMGFAETSVKRLHRQSTKRPMNLVLVELPKNEQNKKIYGITELLYQKIAVESFRTTNRVTQCFNCQVFGHGQLNCFLKPKCVKCAEEHHSKDCPRKSRQLPPKCANCEEAHTANYRGCPKFPRVHQQQPRYPGQYKPNNPLPISKRSETLPKIVEQQNQSNAEVATRKTSRSETKDLCEKYDASNQNISTMNCKLPFKIIAWNCNGIRSGKEELLHFLEVNSIDIALLSETHLKPSIDLKFRNYQTIRTDRITGKSGGTAIIIKSFFKYKNMLIHTLNLENTSILIKPDGKPLLQITAIYKKPDAPLLEEDLNQLIKHNHSIIVAGDWNSKHPLWGSRTSNNSGIVLHNFSERESLDIVAPSSPTHYSPLGNPDFLDFAVLKNIPWTPKARTTDDLSSDHLPVIFELNCPKDEFTTQLSRVTNWVHFQQDIISTTPPRLPLKAEVYIDSAVGILNEKINNSYSKNTIVSSSKLIKNPKTKALIREKNKARKRWQSTWDPAHRATYLNLQGKCVGKKMQPIVIKSTIGPAGENVSIIDTNILLKILERCGIEYKVEETPSTKKRTRESPSDSTPRSHKTPRIEVVSQHNENDVSMNEVTEVPQETSAATPSQVNEENIDEDGPWTKVTHAKKPRIPPVIAENVTDWKLLCQELKDLCTDSYRLQEEKPLKVVLKGVTTAYKTEDIAIELETMGFAETSVKRLHRQSTKRPMNLVLVELPKNEQNKKIYGITELLYQKIAVESFRTTNRVTQCFNCQVFGHGQLNCFLKPKCVKCAEEHHSKDCPRKSRQLPPKCANCEEAHTANYRGCPKFPRVHQQQPRYPGQYKPNNPLPISKRSETLPKIVEQQNQSNAEVATRKTSRSETKDLCEKYDASNQNISTMNCKLPFKIIAWNCNGIRSGKEELLHFLEVNSIDIALLSETHLKPSIDLKFRNYQTIRTDRITGKGGGTAIIIKSFFKYKNMLIHTLNLENTSILIKPDGKPLLQITAIYKKPDAPLLEEDLNQLIKHNHSIIVAGDWNSKHPLWGSRTSNNSGIVLHNFSERESLDIVAPSSPTHYSPLGNPDFLDFAVLKNIPWTPKARTTDDLSSDHLPVIFELNCPKDEFTTQLSRVTNWVHFQQDIISTTPPRLPLKAEVYIDSAVGILNEKINNSYSKNTIVSSSKLIKNTKTKALIREKNKARKRWQSTWDPAHRATYLNLQGK